MKTHYDTFGIPSAASQDEIKKKFRALAHLHHPDKGGDAEVFKGITAAYAVLSDPGKRRSYDLQMGIFSTTGSGYPLPTDWQVTKVHWRGQGVDINDLYAQAQKDVDDMINKMRYGKF